MVNNVLVIGNGFDIAHGLNTKYDDFIKWVRNFKGDYRVLAKQKGDDFCSRIYINGFLKYFLEYTKEVYGWVDLERLIKEIVSQFEKFFIRYTDYITVNDDILINTSSSIHSSVNDIQMMNCIGKFPIFGKIMHNFGDICYSLNSKYYTMTYGLNKREVVKLLRGQLEDLIQLLEIYLRGHFDEKKKELRNKEQIINIKPSYVISFNYTDTYKLYEIDEKDVYHVHGSLGLNNMVLGFDDNDPDNLEFIYFKKYFQRIQKLTGNYEIEKIVLFDEDFGEIHPMVHFYGHSMDNTDGDIIRELDKIAEGFVIYKYSQDDYEQKVINLIDIFGKDEATAMIQSGYVKFVDCEP